MILVHFDQESNFVRVSNQNDFPVLLNFGNYGFAEHGIYRVDAGEYLELDSSNLDDRPIGYQRDKPAKIPCEVSKPPGVRRFERAKDNGSVDWVHRT